MRTHLLCLLSVFAVICSLTLPDTAWADKGEKIAAWENFLRYYPRDPRAKDTFQAIVRAASAPGHYKRNLKYADLVDIEKAQFNEQTGELILIGPRIRDRNRGYLSPLLVVDDLVMALRVLDAVGDRELGVSIGTYRYGATKEEVERDTRLGRRIVDYIPQMTAGTHMGFVLFEADRWLKAVGDGRDNHMLKSVKVRIPGYRTQAERAYPYFKRAAAAISREESGRFTRPYGLNWFLPERPQVQSNGYSMRFASYCMTVQYKAEEPDPAIAAFAEHMTENFDAYCQQFPVFQELVRLHKLVQVAKWYRASDFPDEALLDYTPLRIPTPDYTKSLTTRVGRFSVPGGILETSLVGGVDFSPPNVYVAPAVVPVPLRQQFGPPVSRAFHVPMTIQPRQYGTYAGPAPVPAFVAPIVQARPTPTTYSWTVRIGGTGGRILKAIAIPVTREAIAARSSKPDRQTAALAAAPPRRVEPAHNE